MNEWINKCLNQSTKFSEFWTVPLTSPISFLVRCRPPSLLCEVRLIKSFTLTVSQNYSVPYSSLLLHFPPLSVLPYDRKLAPGNLLIFAPKTNHFLYHPECLEISPITFHSSSYLFIYGVNLFAFFLTCELLGESGVFTASTLTSHI